MSKRKLFEYVKAEVTRGYQLELEEERFQARREKVYMFMTIPRELERLMGYGFFQCADAFLFLFTYLPLRVAFSVFNFAAALIHAARRSTVRPGLKAADRCDMLKLFIFGTSFYIFTFIDTSVLYHVIKSQSVIKLYIFFNMLEVGDRLFASFVQDTIDSLFLTATEDESKKRNTMSVMSHLLLVILTVLGHALVILLQGTTLSVAINANNRALLTVMMSNNFVELKGAVFKKFDKINLFQVSCSDIRERFHLCVLLLVVCLQTMREYSWEESRFWVLFPDCLMVLLAEIGVDWLKHAFICRFNEIPAEVFRDYTLSLAYDLAQTKQRRAFSDHSDMVGRRLGFVPLPLAVVLARVLRPCLGNSADLPTFVLTVFAFMAVASFRTLNSVILLGKACDLIDHHILTTHLNQSPPIHTQPISIVESIKQEPMMSRSSTPTATTTAEVDQLCQLTEVKPAVLQIQRSYSASHTPRPSIGSINDLPPLPADYQYDYDAKLLPANSAVSILSVDFNEEMVAANSSVVPRQPFVLTRKHSLGSNLVDLQFDVKQEEEVGLEIEIERNLEEIEEAPGGCHGNELVGDDKKIITKLKKKSLSGWFKDLSSH